MNKKSVLVIIPTFNPPETLPSFCQAILGEGFGGILILNDGSAPSYEETLQECKMAGVSLSGYSENRGKGNALKCAIEYAHRSLSGYDYYLFCDDDGQHSLADLCRMADLGLQKNSHFILGTRDLRQMPWKSYIGNKAMRIFLRLFHKIEVSDTQCGLRLTSLTTAQRLLGIEEAKFGFELQALILIARESQSIETLEIDTIYIDKNSATRFDPIRDSFDVLKSLFTRNP